MATQAPSQQKSADDKARRLDKADPLAAFRCRFHLPPDTIYLDGNSLGLMSVDAEAALQSAVRAWKELAVSGWTEGPEPWFGLAESLGARMAPLMGAPANSVVVANSTTVNLHQLLATYFQPTPSRCRLLIDALSFPSDRYAVRSHLRLHALDPDTNLVVVPSHDGLTIDERDIEAAMTDDVAVAVLPSVLFRSGQLLPVSRIAAAARRRGIMLMLDCSHSAGLMQHHLEEDGVDFAFWCGYKYLNGGPGASAGMFVNPRHFGRQPGLAGWFSSRKDRQFEMSESLYAMEAAGGLQIGSPNILSMAPLLGSLTVIEEAGINRIRARSLLLTEYLMELADTELSPLGVTVGTPREAHRRGGHVALRISGAEAVCRTLVERRVIPDFRPPDIVRLAPAPLYTTFGECLVAVRRLSAILVAGH